MANNPYYQSYNANLQKFNSIKEVENMNFDEDEDEEEEKA